MHGSGSRRALSGVWGVGPVLPPAFPVSLAALKCVTEVVCSGLEMRPRRPAWQCRLGADSCRWARSEEGYPRGGIPVQ